MCEKVCSGGLFPHDVECVDLYTLSVADVECVDLYTLSVASGTGRQGKNNFEKCDRLKCVKKYALGGFSLTM